MQGGAGMSLIRASVLDGLAGIAAESVQCCVTSPPYYCLRDYGCDGQIGLERSPEDYVAKLVAVFREVRRVLRADGVVWLNLGDSYAMSTKGSSGKGEKQRSNAGTLLDDRRSCIPNGLKPKDLIGIPWAVAFALRSDGWYLRQDIIWAKPNPMPESVRDRCTKAHEYVFLLAKSERYYYNADAIKELAVCIGDTRHLRLDRATDSARPDHGSRARTGNPTGEFRNKRSVWTITPTPFTEAHFAVMPECLVEPCILAGSRPGDTILDPFCGSGTVGLVAKGLMREFVGIDLSDAYIDMAKRRLAKPVQLGIETYMESAQ
jgi:DNA modification methylase